MIVHITNLDYFEETFQRGTTEWNRIMKEALADEYKMNIASFNYDDEGFACFEVISSDDDEVFLEFIGTAK